MHVLVAMQAAPFYNQETAQLKSELEDAIQAAIACMQVDTDDQILDVNLNSNNAAEFAERLAAADYKLYSQADISQKECLNENGYGSFLFYAYACSVARYAMALRS